MASTEHERGSFARAEGAMTRILVTNGDGKFISTHWQLPRRPKDSITVKSVMTGVCRSDIDMMTGKFPLLPTHMSGHEGLGIVIDAGEDSNMKVGYMVATCGEPAYADIYHAKKGTYVRVPELHPRYILEPVACGINIVNQNIDKLRANSGRCLIIGSGFLAYVAYTTMKHLNLDYEYTVVGSHNKKIWGDVLTSDYTGTFDVIIDLGSRNDIFESPTPIYNDNALIVICNQKSISTNFSDMLWKSVTMTFPSPRNPNFYDCLVMAENLVKTGVLNVDHFWTKSYNRFRKWPQAFVDGVERRGNYNRGYIKWYRIKIPTIGGSDDDGDDD